jgi:hypothetical protein
MKVNGLWGLGTVASMDQFGVHFLTEREREREGYGGERE